MKRITISVFFLPLLLAAMASAQEPRIARHGKLSRTARTIGRNVKASFTDMKHDPLWAAYVVGTIAINSADTATTIMLRGLGAPEMNPLLGRYPSTGKLLSLSALATIAEVSAAHMLRERCKNSWKREAADVAVMAEWPLHLRIIKTNINDIGIYGRFRK